MQNFLLLPDRFFRNISPSIRFLCLLLLPVTGVSQSPYLNIQIDRQSSLTLYPPCEPSIAVSPADPSHVVAGAILDRVYTSSDSGRTWNSDRITADYGVFGDPCIVSNSLGDFYYLHLTNPGGVTGRGSNSFLDRIGCQYSTDQGATWRVGKGLGYDPVRDQDKEWAICTPDSKRIYCTWTQFDKYESKVPGDSTNILFSRSGRKATHWKKPVRINQFAGDCSDEDPTVEGAVPACGPGGEIYVAWARNETIYFDRSFNAGKSWLAEDAVVSDISGGWNHDIPGIFRCNGMPVTVCDLSNGPYRGTIYICWADQRNGTSNTDIFVARSEDRGLTWSPPVTVNDDFSGHHQFFPWLTIDQTTGALYIVFYDRRNYSDNQTDVYLASSTNGGASWLNERISESPFVPDAAVFFGDYNNISASGGVVRPIWTRCDHGKLSVLTALVNKP